jgi:hypothetical protein
MLKISEKTLPIDEVTFDCCQLVGRTFANKTSRHPQPSVIEWPSMPSIGRPFAQVDHREWKTAQT